MARKRMIHPEFFKSRKVAELSHRARLTWAGLWIYADDFGRGLDDPVLVKAEVWPLDETVSASDVAEDLTAINALGFTRRYTSKNGQKCFVINAWKEHQKVSHPTKSKLPRPPAVSRAAPESLQLFPEPLARSLVKGSREKSSAGKGATKAKGSVQAHDPKGERQRHELHIKFDKPQPDRCRFCREAEAS